MTKKTFVTFLSKQTAFFHQTFHLGTPIFDNPGNILFSKSKYFLPEFQTELKHSMFHLKEKFSKMILWTSKMHFWEPCWKLSLELGKNFGSKAEKGNRIKLFPKTHLSLPILFLPIWTTEKKFYKTVLKGFLR